LSENSVDFITSNNTFEHVFEEKLVEILKEFNRILKVDGLMSHFIDLSDHFAHADTSITIYNFLKFSDKHWKMIDNDVQPQNRFRINHFRDILSNSGFKIEKENNRPGDISILKGLKLDKQFSDIDTKDCAVSHSYIVLSKL